MTLISAIENQAKKEGRIEERQKIIDEVERMYELEKSQHADGQDVLLKLLQFLKEQADG